MKVSGIVEENYVWEFKKWVNLHPGGSTSITKWHNDANNYTLNYPHELPIWNDNVNNGNIKSWYV